MKKNRKPQRTPRATEIRAQQRLGAILRKARMQSGFSQRDVAKATGISHSEIHQTEVGNQNCRVFTLVSLCYFYELSPAEVLATAYPLSSLRVFRALRGELRILT